MAGVATMKTPPLFKEDEMDYEQWKKDLLLWTEFTDIEKEKNSHCCAFVFVW